ncbi:MAG: hypothetical protein JRN52_06865 [Nitrososphaerota archaeon]|nr:hypothetical protein [Nitrososphaerota archaeon]
MPNDKKYNLYPLVVNCVVSEEKASIGDIIKYVEKTVGERVDPNSVFSVISKLVESRVLKLNWDTTGTFSLDEWKPTEPA